MTATQWIWEYEGLIEKENRDRDQLIEVLKTSRKILVQLLGLDLLVDQDVLEKDQDAFIPYMIMAGRREVAKAILDKLDEEKTSKQAIEDEEFEKLSSAIARGENLGDMEPILDPTIPEEVTKKIHEDELKRAGVKITDHESKAIHIKFDRESMLQRSRATIKELETARKQVDKQLKEEQKAAPDIQVLFDDDAS